MALARQKDNPQGRLKDKRITLKEDLKIKG